MSMRLGVVLLAAGRSVRFGKNKLLAEFDGRPLLCRALEACGSLAAARRLAVVSCEETAALAGAHGFEAIRNDAPQLGQAHSIALGIKALQDMDAALLLAGDMPLLTSESLERLVRRFCESGRGIACLEDDTHRGNPAVFEKKYFPALIALSGDRGAKGVLRAHEDDLLVVRCTGANELADADTLQELKKLREKI